MHNAIRSKTDNNEEYATGAQQVHEIRCKMDLPMMIIHNFLVNISCFCHQWRWKGPQTGQYYDWVHRRQYQFKYNLLSPKSCWFDADDWLNHQILRGLIVIESMLKWVWQLLTDFSLNAFFNKNLSKLLMLSLLPGPFQFYFCSIVHLNG